MATIELPLIQNLLDDIQKLEKSIKLAGAGGRAKLDDIKLIEVCKSVTGDDTKLDAAKWSKLTDDEQCNQRDRSEHGA